MITLKTEKQLQGILLAFSLSVLITDSVAIWQWATHVQNSWGGRLTGLSNSPTFLGSHMLMALPALWWSFKKDNISGQGYLKYFYLFVFLLSLLVLVGTETRGAWVAFAVVFFVYVLTRRINKIQKLGMLVGAILICVATISMVPSLQQRVCSIGNLQHQSNSERLLMWRSACEMLKDYPILGIGADEFALLYNTQYIYPEAVERPEDSSDPRSGHGHPHNNILKRFAEDGIVGGGAFILLNLYLLQRLWQQHRSVGDNTYSFALMGGLVFLGVHLEGMTDTNFICVPVMREFWFLLGFTFAADKIEKYSRKLK